MNLVYMKGQVMDTRNFIQQPNGLLIPFLLTLQRLVLSHELTYTVILEVAVTENATLQTLHQSRCSDGGFFAHLVLRCIVVPIHIISRAAV